MTVYEYGVDLDTSLTFTDGDLKIIKYEDNICQAIMNRLNTFIDSLIFYENYGSSFITFLGWKKRQETLDFMKIELDNTLQQDPRIDSFTSELSYTEDGKVKIEVTLFYFGESINLNYVLNENNIQFEAVE